MNLALDGKISNLDFHTVLINELKVPTINLQLDPLAK